MEKKQKLTTHKLSGGIKVQSERKTFAHLNPNIRPQSASYLGQKLIEKDKRKEFEKKLMIVFFAELRRLNKSKVMSLSKN